MYIIKIIGAIFCQVINNNALAHLSPSRTSGYQKWKGAAPIFIRIALLNKNIEVGINCSIELIKINEFKKENKTRIDAETWTKKYFKEDSEEYLKLSKFIIGIKAKRFNSKPIQILIHE